MACTIQLPILFNQMSRMCLHYTTTFIMQYSTTCHVLFTCVIHYFNYFVIHYLLVTFSIQPCLLYYSPTHQALFNHLCQILFNQLGHGLNNIFHTVFHHLCFMHYSNTSYIIHPLMPCAIHQPVLCTKYF